MNNLLPTKEELIPITNKNETFYECHFNIPFDELDFKSKLQVINDIVRQTLLPKVFSNPLDEQDTLIGNCHTASLISIEYLKKLNIGKNHRYVLARRKPYQPSDITTKHAIVLVDDEENNTYQFDATPFVGFGYGEIKKISEEKLYEEYIPIEGELEYLIYEFRTLMYKINQNTLTEKEYHEYLSLLSYSKKYPILNGFISYLYQLLSKITSSKYDSSKLIEESIILDPYNRLALQENKKNLSLKRELSLQEIKKWQEKLHELLKNPTQNEQESLRLAQNIIQELKLYDNSYERYLLYQGTQIPLSHLSPRFYQMEGLNVAAIKTSAYHLGVRSTIREAILKHGNGAIGEYFTNLASPTESGLIPMLYSHPLGDEYARSMNGPSDIFLVKRPAAELYKIKKHLRSTLGKNIINKEVTWYDGKPILWHPFVTNLIHSSDNPKEAALHYLMGYPEHQLMTRFMYPNPKLEEKVLKK